MCDKFMLLLILRNVQDEHTVRFN